MPAQCDYLDSHLHLQDNRFNGMREAVLLRARQAGVARMFCNATRENDWPDVLALASTHDSIVPFIGIHPWYCDTASHEWHNKLAEILRTTACGIGEAGLDKKCTSDLIRQEEIFVGQLQLAVQFQRPLSVHCLGCWGKLLDILSSQADTGSLPPIMIHSFSGSRETMLRLVRLGCTISFSARMAAPGQERLRQVFQETPLSRVLLETDAPDQLQTTILPNSIPGSGNNEPANVTAFYAFAANLYHLDLQDFCRQIWHNGTVFTDSTFPR